MIVAIIADETDGELEQELEKAADETDGDMSDWMRGAFIIRLYMENDGEFLEQAKDDRSDK